MPETYITKYNQTIDDICYRYYGSTANREVEIVLDANPGLETQPILLAAGLSITLPDIDQVQVQVVKTIKLWE